VGGFVMATQMRIDDEIRLNIIEALLKNRSVVPNIRQIKKYTSYHKATIKSSLDFLMSENLLIGFGPRINVRRFGVKLEVIELLQADLSEKKLFERFLKAVQKDSHTYRLSSIVGSGNLNLVARHIYPDIESFHANTQKQYYEKIPGLFKLIKDRQIFYSTEPFYKNESRTKSIIETLKKEKGLE
jgi:DNA-binding Lrp family transcriptional regulator